MQEIHWSEEHLVLWTQVKSFCKQLVQDFKITQVLRTLLHSPLPSHFRGLMSCCFLSHDSDCLNAQTPSQMCYKFITLDLSWNPSEDVLPCIRCAEERICSEQSSAGRHWHPCVQAAWWEMVESYIRCARSRDFCLQLWSTSEQFKKIFTGQMENTVIHLSCDYPASLWLHFCTGAHKLTVFGGSQPLPAL